MSSTTTAATCILTATRDGLSIDSDNAKDWNDDASPPSPPTEQVTSYRALMIAGPSDKGQELAAKVNAGEELTWDDLNSANWSVMGTSSSCRLHLSGPVAAGPLSARASPDLSQRRAV